jgi:glycosyltransferase involved in cell wall biosynthesis
MSPTSPDRDPIRVLALLDDTVVSGKVKPVLALARHACKNSATPRGLDVSMLTFVRAETDPELVKTLREEGFVIDVVRERRRFDLRVFPQLRTIIERRRPHVLWTHGAKTHFLVRAAGLHHKKAWVAFHHGYTATSLAWRLYDQLDRWSLLGADRVMTACEAFATDLNVRLGIRRERLSVHRSPLAADASPTPRSDAGALRKELGLPPDAQIVLSVGRLSKEKGHADLIRAMVYARAQRPEAVLLIVGDGPEQPRLEHLCTRLGLVESIRFVGYRNDVAPYYEAASVFALTSHSEGSPNVLLEAMQAEVPIVATAVGGVGEMIRHREHGLLVPRGDVEAIASGIVELLGNPELCRALTSAAHQSLAAYSLERYYTDVHSVFEAVVPSR